METTWFPKKYASSRAGLRFPIGSLSSSCTWKLFIFRGNHVVSMEISWLPNPFLGLATIVYFHERPTQPRRGGTYRGTGPHACTCKHAHVCSCTPVVPSKKCRTTFDQFFPNLGENGRYAERSRKIGRYARMLDFISWALLQIFMIWSTVQLHRHQWMPIWYRTAVNRTIGYWLHGPTFSKEPQLNLNSCKRIGSLQTAVIQSQ